MYTYANHARLRANVRPLTLRFFFFFKRFPLGLIIRKDIRSCFFISSREKRILFFPLRLPPFQRCVKHSSFFPINFSPPRNFQFSIEFRASRAPKTISRYGSKGNEKQSETNQSLMETATREQWRRGGKVTPVKKKKKEWKKFEIYECIESARCRFLTGGGGNWIDGGGGRQFRRGSAASICARRRRLLDKRSNSLCKEIYYGARRDVFSIPPFSEGMRIYLLYIYMYIHTFFHRLSNTFHVAATRSPRSSSSCILRDILEWREANGNRQMIHEDVKRDV